MQARPVSVYISPRALNRIDQEAKRERRSRSDWIETLFETLFFKEEEPKEIAIKIG
jgi:metal-responsive CopG/Arc/MetJ family transcriptional regulator